MACIEARGLRKAFGTTIAVDGINLRVEEGRILGLIGPNGAGKTTALNAILGLTSYQGELRVLGRDPWTEREKLMRDACFIADVAVLPRWMRVWQALDYFAGVQRRMKPVDFAQIFLSVTAVISDPSVDAIAHGCQKDHQGAKTVAEDGDLPVHPGTLATALAVSLTSLTPASRS